MNDRFGIGWRPELAAGILANLDRIGIVEVIADDYFEAPKAERRALKTLARQVPVALHGVTLGLASAAPVESRRLRRSAKLIDEVQPEFWSEHLAFVRGGGLEIGHLAAPPRTDATIDGAARNISAAKRIAGTAPLVENIATLIDPPASVMGEADWTRQILEAADCDLLLDLHNLYANAVNFGVAPIGFIESLPLERIRVIHLAGGRWIGALGTSQRRLLDDHLHDVPEPVYELLRYVGEKTPHRLTVILERDGHFPPMASLLSQLERARQELERGRQRLKLTADMVAA
ncbi:MAG: DUF692 domain-containing protein [Deltaproteobacteria bacterium]|nr:DUF692 domain-containing protein [Deltaproteobacteria bacterium]